MFVHILVMLAQKYFTLILGSMRISFPLLMGSGQNTRLKSTWISASGVEEYSLEAQVYHLQTL